MFGDRPRLSAHIEVPEVVGCPHPYDDELAVDGTGLGHLGRVKWSSDFTGTDAGDVFFWPAHMLRTVWEAWLSVFR